MRVVSIRERKDGSATVRLELEDREYAVLMRAGIQEAVGRKYRVVPVEEARKLGVKCERTYAMSKAEADFMVGLAVLAALRKMIEKAEDARRKAKGRKG